MSRQLKFIGNYTDKVTVDYLGSGIDNIRRLISTEDIVSDFDINFSLSDSHWSSIVAFGRTMSFIFKFQGVSGGYILVFNTVDQRPNNRVMRVSVKEKCVGQDIAKHLLNCLIND